MVLKLGLIGNPIKHSLSPWIHHHFMESLGIEGKYELYETSWEELSNTVELVKERAVDGFNITVPYKQAIIPYLDELDPDAAKVGAVNTAVNINGKWKGYNTDGLGYVRSVKTFYPDIFQADNKVLMLGAGGAARGIYRALVQQPFTCVDIANRTLSKAESLLELKNEQTDTNIITFKQAEKQLNNYQFVVQTTSVGMKPNVDNQIIKLNNLARNTVVSDIVYQPLKTKLLQSAEQQNGLIHQGHAMLLYQAQLAFELWTNKQVKMDNILQQLEDRLRGK